MKKLLTPLLFNFLFCAVVFGQANPAPVIVNQPAETQQSPIKIGVEAIDKFVEAVNGKKYEILKPYISEQTKVGNVPPAYTEAVLSQMFAQLGRIAAARIVKTEKETENTRYFCSFAFGDKTREFDFLLSPQNKFLELNVVKVEVKKITNQFDQTETERPTSLEIPFRLAEKHILVRAEINGRTGDFIFDTGAPALFLNQAHFAKPAGNSVTTGDAKGVSGNIGGLSYFKAQTFDWAGIGFKDKDVATLNLAHLEKALQEKEILGLIGYSLIEKYTVTFDYVNRRLLLNLPSATVANSTKPFFTAALAMQKHLPIIELKVGGKSMRFAVDSGAGSNLISREYEAELTPALVDIKKETLIGADNKPLSVTKGILPKAVLGERVEFKNMATVFSDISHLNKGEVEKIDGILGYEFLRQYKTVVNFTGKSIEFYK